MFVGDPHGRFEHIVAAHQECKSQSTILVGDMCYKRPIHELLSCVPSVHWVPGNHDADNQVWHDSLFHSAWSDQSLDASVKEVSGVRIAGLGGIFRSSIWNPNLDNGYQDKTRWLEEHSTKRYAQLRRKHTSSIWRDDYVGLSKLNADILITHEAPSCHRHGFKALDKLAADLGVKLVVHGHHHEFYTDVIGNDIVVVGLDLAQIVNLDIHVFKQAKTSKEVLSVFDFRNHKKGGDLQ